MISREPKNETSPLIENIKNNNQNIHQQDVVIKKLRSKVNETKQGIRVSKNPIDHQRDIGSLKEI